MPANKTGPSAEERQRRYEELLQEELGKPMAYVFHDANASADERLEDLREVGGFEALGRWWLLVERLAARQWHRYDIRRPSGWKRLARDLEFDGDGAVDACREFVEYLVALGLLDQESYRESGSVHSARLDRNAYRMAENAASKRLGAWVRDWVKNNG